MDTREFSWESDVLPVVKDMAKKRFAQRHDAEDLIADAMSYAWQNHQANKDAPPPSVAWLAIRRVESAQRFQRTRRSIDSPMQMAKSGQKKETFTVFSLTRVGTDPADIAQLKLDWAAFVRESLTKRQRRILQMALLGEQTQDIAKHFGVTAGAVSQTRRRIVELWKEFQA